MGLQFVAFVHGKNMEPWDLNPWDGRWCCQFHLQSKVYQELTRYRWVNVIRSIIHVYLCIDDFHGFPLKTFIYRVFPIATFDYQSVCLCSRVYYQSVLPMLCHEFVSPASVDFSCKRSEFVQKSVYFFHERWGSNMGIATVIGFCENTAVAPVNLQPAVGDAGHGSRQRCPCTAHQDSTASLEAWNPCWFCFKAKSPQTTKQSCTCRRYGSLQPGCIHISVIAHWLRLYKCPLQRFMSAAKVSFCYTPSLEPLGCGARAQAWLSWLSTWCQSDAVKWQQVPQDREKLLKWTSCFVLTCLGINLTCFIDEVLILVGSSLSFFDFLHGHLFHALPSGNLT